MSTVAKLQILDKNGRDITANIPAVRDVELAMAKLYASLMPNERVLVNVIEAQS